VHYTAVPAVFRVAQIALTGYYTGISLHPKQMDAQQIEDIYRACL
jgi:hypothetical protein